MDMEFWYSQFNTIGYQPYQPTKKVEDAIAEASANANSNNKEG